MQSEIGTFLKKISDNKKIEIWGDGLAGRDFIYISVSDLVGLYLKAGLSSSCGIFIAGSGVDLLCRTC